MKILKWMSKSLLVVVLVMLLFWAIVLSLLQTKQGQEWVYDRFISYLEEQTGTQIQIGKVNFFFPLHLSLENIVVSQEQDTFLTIQKLEIACSYSSLLQGRILIPQLQISDIEVLKIPHVIEFSSSSSASSLGWETPRFPFYLKLQQIDIQRLHLSQQIVNTLSLPSEMDLMTQQSFFNLRGAITNNPFKTSITAHLQLTAHQEKSEPALWTLGIDTENHQLSFSFHSLQFPLQTDYLPSFLKAQLALYAYAPLSTWHHLILKSEEKHSPIMGHFTLKLDPSSNEPPPNLAPLIGQPTTFASHYQIKSSKEIELSNFKVENPNFSLEGSTTLTSNLEIHQGTFKGKIENIECFQTLLKKDIQGQLNVEGHVKGPLQSLSLIVHMESPRLLFEQHLFNDLHSTFQINPSQNNWNGFASLDFVYQNTPWKMTSSFDWNDQKRLTLSQFNVNAMHSHLTALVSCDIPDFIWEGTVEAKVTDLKDLSQLLKVPMNGEGQFKIQLGAITDENQQKRQQCHIDFKGNALQWDEWQVGRLSCHFDLTPREGKNHDFFVQSYLEGQSIHWKDYSVESCTAQASQEIDLTHRTISHLSTDWKVKKIQSSIGQIDQIVGHAQLTHPFEMPEGNIQLKIQQLQTATLYLEELIVASTFDPSQKQWPFQINGRGVWKEDLIISTKGTWHYQQNLLEVQADHLHGRFGPYPLQLGQSLRFRSYPDKIELRDVHLKWGEAEVKAEFHQEHDHFSTWLKTNPVPSELFHFIAPDLPLVGRSTLQGHLEGHVAHPKGRFQLELHNIQFTEDLLAHKPFIAGNIYFDLNEQGVQVNSQLYGLGQTPMVISGQLPIALRIDPFDFKMNSHLPFHLNLDAEGKLDPYLQLFYNDVTNLSGEAKIALKFSGQMHHPQMKGSIDFMNGTYETLSTGMPYRNIQAHLEGDGSKIILKQFSAQDNQNGWITATGAILLDFNQQFPFEFHIHPKKIHVLDSDYAAIEATGDLYLAGNMKQSKLEGNLTVDQATVHLEQNLPNKFKTVDIHYFNLSDGEKLPNYLEKKERNSVIELDIKLNAPRGVVIQGNHIQSEWKGFVHVTGTTNQLQLNGDLRISKGEYDFNGKIFNLTQGNIHFAGSPDKKTTLYVVASKDIDRIRADIIVKGPVTKPVISFRSNPPLSQREVLSYILFNRGISDITPDQGDQLSQSFMSLNANEQPKGGMDFLSRLRNNIGIDRLDFTTGNTEKKEIGLQIGKYITEDIFVSVNQSMVSLSPIIAVEAKFRKNFKAQAEAGMGEDLPVRMSIKWKKDY